MWTGIIYVSYGLYKWNVVRTEHFRRLEVLPIGIQASISRLGWWEQDQKHINHSAVYSHEVPRLSSTIKSILHPQSFAYGKPLMVSPSIIGVWLCLRIPTPERIFSTKDNLENARYSRFWGSRARKEAEASLFSSFSFSEIILTTAMNDVSSSVHFAETFWKGWRRKRKTLLFEWFWCIIINFMLFLVTTRL